MNEMNNISISKEDADAPTTELFGVTMPNRLMTISEVAAIMRLTPRTVARIAEEIKASYHRIGSSVRFAPEEVKKILHESRLTFGADLLTALE